MKRLLLFTAASMISLAEKISANQNNITLGEIDWNHFSDGFPNTFIKNVGELRNYDVAFLADFSNPANIFEQLGVIYALPRYFAQSLQIVLPYFPTGTNERVIHEGEVATAKTLARQLSTTPLTKSGPAQLIMYDIHALQERFYFGDQILPRLESAVPFFIKQVLTGIPDLAIAFPDEGAKKRFGIYFPEKDFDQIICLKVRDGEKRIVKIKEGDPRGKNVVEIDDLIQKGTTLIECEKALHQAGAKSVSAFTTHGVLPGEAAEKLQASGLETIWISDSLPQSVEKVLGLSKFKILSLAEIIFQTIT